MWWHIIGIWKNRFCSRKPQSGSEPIFRTDPTDYELVFLLPGTLVRGNIGQGFAGNPRTQELLREA